MNPPPRRRAALTRLTAAALALALALLTASAAAWQLPPGAAVEAQRWTAPADAPVPPAALPAIRARLHHAGVAGHLIHAADGSLWLLRDPTTAPSTSPLRHPGRFGIHRVAEDPRWLDAAIATHPLPPGVTRDGNQLVGPDRATITRWVAGRLAPDHHLFFERRPDATWATVLARSAGLDDLRPAAARAETTPYGPVVHLTLTPADADRFAALTAASIDTALALVLDDTVHSRPIVREAITGGRLQLSLGHGPDAARDAHTLAAALRAPPLPLALTLVAAVDTARIERRDGDRVTARLADRPLVYDAPGSWNPAACILFAAPGCRITLGREVSGHGETQP